MTNTIKQSFSLSAFLRRFGLWLMAARGNTMLTLVIAAALIPLLWFQIAEMLIMMPGNVPLIFAAVVVMLPLLWFADLLMALVTLRLGWREGLLCCGVIAAVSGLEIALIKKPVAAAFLPIVGSSVLLWMLACVLRETRSWARVLYVTLFLGIAIIVVARILVSYVTDGWQMPLIMGLVVSSVVIGMTIRLLVARYWQALLYNKGGLYKEISQLRLSPKVSLACVVCIVLAINRTSIAVDILPVFVVVFFTFGILLLHVFILQHQYKWPLLILTYIIMTIMMGFMLGFCVLLAMLDSFFDLRKQRISKIS